jgi:acetyl-CoA carboxylase carboxyl transferase beta subunit
VPTAGGKLPPIALTTNCPSCGVGLTPEVLRERAYVCDCGHHFRMHADAWIALLADQGTWVERWADIRPHDLLGWMVPKPYRETIEQARAEGLNEAVRTGVAELAGRPVWLGVFDFRFVGGSLSIVAGERLARGFEQATASRVPFVLVVASGGARMQEGVLALMQMAKVNGAVGRLHRAGVPFFSVLTNPTYGGTSASLALLADVNLAEPDASIGFTGPRVIRQATYEDLPEGFQSADFARRTGQVDMVVPRTELRPTLARLHDLYWGNARR